MLPSDAEDILLYAGNTINLKVSLDVTTTSVGSGFYGNLLIGDPPATTTASKVQSLASSLAVFAANNSHMHGEDFFSGAMKRPQLQLAVAR